ncbi:MAG: RimK/LysX family protein [Sulfuricurvum sp.]
MKKLYLPFAMVLLFGGCTIKEPPVSEAKLQELKEHINVAEHRLTQKVNDKIVTLEAKNSSEIADLKDSRSELRASLAKTESQLQEISTRLDELKDLQNRQNEQLKLLGAPPPDAKIKELKSFKDKLVVGGVERVQITPSEFILDARIDTGAEISSIDARGIEEFERDGKKWVRFEFPSRVNDESFVIEKQIARHIKITQSSNEQGSKRVVVALKLRLANKTQLVEFSLTDRSHMNYGVLVGRNALQDMIVVDVSRDHLAPLVLEENGISKP